MTTEPVAHEPITDTDRIEALIRWQYEPCDYRIYCIVIGRSFAWLFARDGVERTYDDLRSAIDAGIMMDRK